MQNIDKGEDCKIESKEKPAKTVVNKVTESEQPQDDNWKDEICESFRAMLDDIKKRQQVIEFVIKDCTFKDVALKHQQAFIKSHLVFCLNLLPSKQAHELH